MEYPFKKGFKPDITRIQKVIEEEFPDRIEEENGRLLFSYGALKKGEVWIENKHLFVLTESSPNAGDEMVLDTNKRFRNFLEKATGYTVHQRMKMAKKEVQKVQISRA